MYCLFILLYFYSKNLSIIELFQSCCQNFSIHPSLSLYTTSNIIIVLEEKFSMNKEFTKIVVAMIFLKRNLLNKTRRIHLFAPFQEKQHLCVLLKDFH